MRIMKPAAGLLLVASIFCSCSWRVANPRRRSPSQPLPNAEREKFLRTLQQVRKNFESADEDGDDVITRGQFRVFVDANAEIDFAMSKQIKRMRAYQRAFWRALLAIGTEHSVVAHRQRNQPAKILKGAKPVFLPR